MIERYDAKRTRRSKRALVLGPALAAPLITRYFE
jgi:hypothetical protein